MRLKLFVVSHKEVEIPAAKYLYPIRSDWADGIHIAKKANYCELRAQYWVWKNERLDDKDYIGFFHYRRYLELNRKKLINLSVEKKRPTPYRIKKHPDEEMYSSLDAELMINGYEAIAPVWEYTGIPVWERYQGSSRQRAQDLSLIYEIIAEKYPDFLQSADMYLSGNGEYYGNIYIMRWDRFQEYCTWLFGILEEFDQRVTDALPFTDGFLGERLFGVYFTWLSAQKGVHCGELPRVHFSAYDDERHHSGRDYLVNVFLPPGSAVRAYVRKIIYKGRKKGNGNSIGQSL